MKIGALFQIGTLFAQVNYALNFFVNTYETIADYQIKVQRITGLNKASLVTGLATSEQSIKHQTHNSNAICLENLSITTPKAENKQYITKTFNISFNGGEYVLIKGDSGIGKSTVFKAINHAWSYGEGTI